MNNNTVSPSGFIIFSFFALMFFSLQSCVSARNRSTPKKEKHEWRIVKTDKQAEPSWVIYTRAIAGTSFLEYKIEGDIQSSPHACLASFRQELYAQANDTKNKKYPTYKIADESRESLLTYVIHREPFPLKDTEMSVRYTFFSDEDGSTSVRWNEAWNESPVQPSKKLNRVKTFRGSWSFFPASGNACKAANVVQFDPGKMPLWLVQPMVFSFLKGGLRDIREKAGEL